MSKKKSTSNHDSVTPYWLSVVEATKQNFEELKSNVKLNLEHTPNRSNKDTVGKLDWSLVDFEALSELVKVLEFGAKKYSRDGWRKGIPIDDLISAIIRHVIKLKEVSFLDEESGLSHCGHIMANAMFLQVMIKRKQELLKKHDGENNK